MSDPAATEEACCPNCGGQLVGATHQTACLINTTAEIERLRKPEPSDPAAPSPADIEAIAELLWRDDLMTSGTMICGPGLYHGIPEWTRVKYANRAKALLASPALATLRAHERAEARREVGLWATQRKAFMEAHRDRELAVDRHNIPTLSSEFWRGHESALDDVIRLATADNPNTDPTLPELRDRADRQGQS